MLFSTSELEASLAKDSKIVNIYKAEVETSQTRLVFVWYNPHPYQRNTRTFEKLLTNLFSSTTPKPYSNLAWMHGSVYIIPYLCEHRIGMKNCTGTFYIVNETQKIVKNLLECKTILC